MKIEARDWLKIPNILSCIRIVLIPIFVYIYLKAEGPLSYYLAAFVVILSGITDKLDGVIARKYGQITELGKLLDPVADKLTQGAILYILIPRYRVFWLLLGFLVFKEIYMGILGIVCLSKGKTLDGALWIGKVSTTVFYVATIILIGYPAISWLAAQILTVIVGVFLLLSLILYTQAYYRLYRS